MQAGVKRSLTREIHRPLRAASHHTSYQLAVLEKAKRLKRSFIFINEDFSDAVCQRRKELILAMKAARE